MDLNQFALLKAQAQGVQSKRQNQAGNFLQDGLALLARIHEQGPAQALMIQAFQTLQQALQYNRSDPAPYIALGYLFVLVSDTANALKYFRAVLDMSPNHPDALAFIAYVQQVVSQPRASSSQLDYDALYDEVEALIHNQLTAIQGLTPHPMLERRGLNTLRMQVSQFQTNRETMAIKLALVDQEIDISDLQQQLLPFDEALSQFEHTLAQSLRMVALEQDIEAQLQDIEALERALQAQQEFPFDESLEHILDQCDACADQLDALEKEGVTINALEAVYNQLLRAVEQFQEQLEEQ